MDCSFFIGKSGLIIAALDINYSEALNRVKIYILEHAAGL